MKGNLYDSNLFAFYGRVSCLVIHLTSCERFFYAGLSDLFVLFNALFLRSVVLHNVLLELKVGELKKVHIGLHSLR